MVDAKAVWEEISLRGNSPNLLKGNLYGMLSIDKIGMKCSLINFPYAYI